MNTLIQTIRQIFSIFRWWFVVMPWEQAIRVQLGKHPKVLGPGVHLKLPFIHDVFKQSVRLRAAGMPTQTISTKDGKTITLSASAGFCIKDILKLYQTLHNADGTIIQLIEIAVANYVFRHDFADCEPSAICAAALQEVDLERFGLGDIRLSINSFAVVKTYRLISDQRWFTGGSDVNTTLKEGAYEGPVAR